MAAWTSLADGARAMAKFSYGKPVHELAAIARQSDIPLAKELP